MRSIEALIYRYLTDADFFNIYKPTGTESKGGGQTYIDFSTKDVPVTQWKRLLGAVTGVVKSKRANGPSWDVPIHSIGVPLPPQKVEIFQRRPQSIVVARQRIGSRHSNRVVAWKPEHGFPRPIDPESRDQCPDGLVVYFALCSDKTVWAGWFLNDGRSPQPFDSSINPADLGKFLHPPGKSDPRAGVVRIDAAIRLNESSVQTPFKRSGAAKIHSLPPNLLVAETDSEVDQYLEQDIEFDANRPPAYSIVRIRRRNTKAANALKKLYGHTCQITGTEYLFKKRDGTYYTEVHHLVPLGKGGADDPRNMIVLSPQLHKMLHHAAVDSDSIDLAKMEPTKDGRWKLDITINDKPYRIHWLPAHANIIQGAEE